MVTKKQKIGCKENKKWLHKTSETRKNARIVSKDTPSKIVIFRKGSWLGAHACIFVYLAYVAFAQYSNVATRNRLMSVSTHELKGKKCGKDEECKKHFVHK